MSVRDPSHQAAAAGLAMLLLVLAACEGAPIAPGSVPVDAEPLLAGDRSVVQSAAGVLGAGVVTGAATVVVARAQQAATTQLHACVNQNSGDVKFVSEDTQCHANATKVSWNVTGPPGPPGVSGYEVLERTLSVTAEFSGVFGGLQCPAGKRPLGGGASIDNAPAGYAIVSNRPLRPGDFGIADPQGWFGLLLRVDQDVPTAAFEGRLFVTCAFVD
jgi:hypothetical protein